MSALTDYAQSPIDQFSKIDVLSFLEKDIRKVSPDFSVTNYGRITLSKNSSDEYHVNFSNAVNYVPLSTASYYDAYCIFHIIQKNGIPNIAVQQSGFTSYGSDTDLKAKGFHVSTNAITKKVNKLLSIAEISSIEREDRCVIYERRDQYDVWLINTHVEGFWNIAKKTLSVINKGHNSLVPSPIQENEWTEIVWK